MVLPRLPRKPATIRGKNRLRFQIVGISNHAKTRVIIGLQPSDIKIYRTDVTSGDNGAASIAKQGGSS